MKQASSLTVNKVQGQTLMRVSVWLEDPVFSHGQFYVAASRISNPNNICFFIENSDDGISIRNLVYKDVLSRLATSLPMTSEDQFQDISVKLL